MVKNKISVPGVYQEPNKFDFLKWLPNRWHTGGIERKYTRIQNVIEPDEEDKDYGSLYIQCHS